MLPVFCTVGGVILYSATPPNTNVGADAARFFYTVGCANLYCATPIYPTVGANAAFIFFTIGARTPTFLPLPTLLLGQMLLVFFIRFGGAHVYCATPYTARRV